MRYRQVMQPLNGFQSGINGLSAFAPMQMHGRESLPARSTVYVPRDSTAKAFLSLG